MIKTGRNYVDDWIAATNRNRLKMDRGCMPKEWSEYKLLTILKDRVKDNIERYEEKLMDVTLHREAEVMIIFFSIESRKYLNYLKYRLRKLK